MKCAYCNNKICMKEFVLFLLKNQKTYSLNQLSKKLDVQNSSMHVVVKKLEKENKILVIRNGRGKKIQIKSNSKGGSK